MRIPPVAARLREKRATVNVGMAASLPALAPALRRAAVNSRPTEPHHGKTESPAQARRLLQSDRPSCRVVAASAGAGRRRHQLQALRRDRADRRARQVRHDLPRRQRLRARGQDGGAVALGAVHRQLRADHADLGARRRHRAHRPHLHRVDELQRAVPRGAQVRLARPHQRRPRRLEPGHLRHGGRGAELQPRRPLRPCRALRARQRVRRGRHRAVGQLGRRRLHARQGERAVLRSGQAARAQPQGQALPGARPAQHSALAAGPSGDRAGRHLRRRHGRRGALRRGDLLRAPDDGVLPASTSKR